MPTEKQFIVLSVTHTKRYHAAITLWRADDKGYCWQLAHAGRYSESAIMGHLGYYNSGDNIAVPLEVVEQLATETRYDIGETGICLPHHQSVWAHLLESVIAEPCRSPQVELNAVRADKLKRLSVANKAMRAISNHGRRFFYSQASGSQARMELDHRGRIWFVDDYSGKWIYVAYSGRWRGFTHGGTLRNLVEQFAEYVRTGKRLHPGYIGLERDFSEGNIWGYEAEALKRVREECLGLDCFAVLTRQAA